MGDRRQKKKRRHARMRRDGADDDSISPRDATDAVFGKHNASRGLRESDPFDLYDWMLNAYAAAKPDQLAKQ
jgi:hypothetical protein